MTLKQLCQKVRINNTHGARLASEKQSDWQQKAQGYTCKLAYKRRRMTVDFWQGYGILHEPTAEGVLMCFLSDAEGTENRNFEEWCSDLGYDTDSRTAERTFKACEKLATKLRAFLGDDYETFMAAERD
jgi:hypothetical protein